MVQNSRNIFIHELLRIGNSAYNVSPRFTLIKMADMLRSGEGSEPSNWELFFGAAVDILDECEALWETGDRDCREAVQIRLEYVIQALQ